MGLNNREGEPHCLCVMFPSYYDIVLTTISSERNTMVQLYFALLDSHYFLIDSIVTVLINKIYQYLSDKALPGADLNSGKKWSGANVSRALIGSNFLLYNFSRRLRDFTARSRRRVSQYPPTLSL